MTNINNTLNNSINNKAYNRFHTITMMRQEIERDIYGEHTLNNVQLILTIPQINISFIILDILKIHNYVLKEIHNMSANEIEILLHKNPSYIVDRIHESYVIEAAILDALIATTNNNIFYDIEYIHAHFNNPIWQDLYHKYYIMIYEPIIQKLNQFSEAYLQFVLLKHSMH